MPCATIEMEMCLVTSQQRHGAYEMLWQGNKNDKFLWCPTSIGSSGNNNANLASLTSSEALAQKMPGPGCTRLALQNLFSKGSANFYGLSKKRRMTASLDICETAMAEALRIINHKYLQVQEKLTFPHPPFIHLLHQPIPELVRHQANPILQVCSNR